MGVEPIGPQIQALYHDPMSAKNMQYLYEETQHVFTHICCTRQISILSDITMGLDYLVAAHNGNIKEHDTVLMVSLDGVQLFDSKESNCWVDYSQFVTGQACHIP
ncbi:hypothetical protein BS17DRAFT_690040 [Gyrodon lividus]|nr:hypothetical protein BS17DRAFT_690040 [Gyrodon lividus]